MKHDVLKKQPVARFFYKGNNHSHPVRRTVLIIKTSKKIITGYELREGDVVHSLDEAPIKSYRRDRIPNWGDYWRLRRYNKNFNQTTVPKNL
jgi:hypothetical protein